MSEEDRLTYALQAEGPDEFPEDYYRSIARERLAAVQETYEDRILNPNLEDFCDGDRHLVVGTDYSHVPHRGQISAAGLTFAMAAAERDQGDPFRERHR